MTVALWGAELVPTGRLRVSLNMANTVLAFSRTALETPAGVTVDLSRELAGRLGVEIEFLEWASPGQSLQAVARGHADAGYLAVDPKRAEEVQFTRPYVQIEACYMVRENSVLREQSEVDRPGIEVLVIETSAYDLHLTRSLKHASLARFPRAEDVLNALLHENSGRRVVAGIRQGLVEQTQRLPGLRLLGGHFFEIAQAMVLPRTTSEGALAATEAFLDEMVESGFVAQSLDRHQISGATVLHNRGLFSRRT